MSCEASTGAPPHPEPPNSPWTMLSAGTAPWHPLPVGSTLRRPCPCVPLELKPSQDAAGEWMWVGGDTQLQGLALPLLPSPGRQQAGGQAGRERSGHNGGNRPARGCRAHPLPWLCWRHTGLRNPPTSWGAGTHLILAWGTSRLETGAAPDSCLCPVQVMPLPPLPTLPTPPTTLLTCGRSSSGCDTSP